LLSRVPLLVDMSVDLFFVPVGSHQIKFPRQAKTGHDPLTIVGNGDDLWRMAVDR
jgi:hypothetical protein